MNREQTSNKNGETKISKFPLREKLTKLVDAFKGNTPNKLSSPQLDRTSEIPHYFGVEVATNEEYGGIEISTQVENRCHITDLRVFNDPFRLEYFRIFNQEVLDQNKGYLLLEIDLRNLKLLNDKLTPKGADEVIKFFVSAMKKFLKEKKLDTENIKFMLYRQHSGGDDFSFGMWADTKELELIAQEFPLYLNNMDVPEEILNHFAPNSRDDSDEDTLKEVRQVGGETGVALLPAGANLDVFIQELENEIQYPESKKKIFSELETIDKVAYLYQLLSEKAVGQLVAKKLEQIALELIATDNKVIKRIFPIVEGLSPEINYDNLILDLLQPPIGKLHTLENVRQKFTQLENTLFTIPNVTAINKPEHYANLIIQATEDIQAMVAETYGSRRMTEPGQRYAGLIVAKAAQLRTKVLFDIPLGPKDWSFLGLINTETSEKFQEYVNQLVQREMLLQQDDAIANQQDDSSASLVTDPNSIVMSPQAKRILNFSIN